jgi:hypothetical protein
MVVVNDNDQDQPFATVIALRVLETVPNWERELPKRYVRE